jgi:3-oxoacyl-[acyl-carrier-protein] synthase II
VLFDVGFFVGGLFVGDWGRFGTLGLTRENQRQHRQAQRRADDDHGARVEVMLDAAGRRIDADGGDNGRQAREEPLAQERGGSAGGGDEPERHRGQLGITAGQPQRPDGVGRTQAGDEGDGDTACVHRSIFYHAPVPARCVVTAIGVVSPLGVGEAAFFDALATGRRGVGRDEDGTPAARVGDFGARQQIAPGNLRRLPRLSQMAIVAGKQALAVGAPVPHYDPTRVGVVLGTGLGTLDETIHFMRGYLEGGPEAASPLLFPSSVMNAAAGQLALECKLRGVNSTVNHRDASPLQALAMACDLLALGRADALLVGAVDELNAPALAGYRRLGGLSATAMRPYSAARDGLVLGESAAMLLVEREADAIRRGAAIRAYVDGRGESGETRPRIGWGSAGQSDNKRDDAWPEAARAVREAAAGRPIDWVAGGGNGSRQLDERELATLAAGLDTLPPTSSILAQTGESLSSAMLRVVAALFALERQTIPATLDLVDPPARFAASLPAATQAATIDRVLIPTFAQGGANVALVLGRR